MGDWSVPILTTPYSDFLDQLKVRDVDAVSLYGNGAVNPPVNAIWYDRSTNVFRQWNGSGWVALVLSAAGGGTGSAAGFPTLGTMSTQNANNVAITGGSVTGLSALGVNGTSTLAGVNAGAITASSLAAGGHISANTVTANGLTSNGNGNIAQDLYTNRVICASNAYTRGQIIAGNADRIITTADGRIPNFTSYYFAAQQGHEITNLNGSAIDRGSIWVGFIGTGATGQGTHILLDNGTWVPKSTLGGGMVEIVHSSFSVPQGGNQSITVTIPWTGPMPASAKKIHVQVNQISEQGQADGQGIPTLPVMANWVVTGANTFSFFKQLYAASGYQYTAFHHRTEV